MLKIQELSPSNAAMPARPDRVLAALQVSYVYTYTLSRIRIKIEMGPGASCQKKTSLPYLSEIFSPLQRAEAPYACIPGWVQFPCISFLIIISTES